MEYWRGKRILIVSPEPWGVAKLSKHHYAEELVRYGAVVFFMGPSAGKGYHLDARTTTSPNLVRTPKLLRGLRFLPRYIRAKIEAFRLGKIALTCGGGFDIIWNFDLYQFNDLTDRKHGKTRLLHIMDLPDPQQIRSTARIADGVIYVSETMVNHLPENHPPSLHVPHGTLARKAPQKPILPPTSQVRVCYVGNLAMKYLHWPALLEIASEHPEITLFLIGPMGGQFGGNAPVNPKAWMALKRLPNVEWIGELPSESIPAWLQAMDILLISYDSEKYLDIATGSHKLLEYLASGKAILSSYLKDYRGLDDLITMMPPGIPISTGFDRIVEQLQVLNDDELAEKRINYANNRTYEKHLERIAKFVSKLRPDQV